MALTFLPAVFEREPSTTVRDASPDQQLPTGSGKIESVHRSLIQKRLLPPWRFVEKTTCR